MTLSRRGLLKISAAGALLPLAPGVRVAGAAPLGANNNIFVHIFLRDGMDGLQLVAPSEDGSFRDNRRRIAIRSEGLGAGFPIGSLDRVPFFLHPAAGQLKEMFNAGSLAIVHAAGMPSKSRSHFQSQTMMDMGTADNEQEPANGWLTRHLRAKTGDLGLFAATADITTGTSPLGGMAGIVPTGSLESLPYTVYPERGRLIAALNQGNAASAVAARHALDLVETVRARQDALPPRDWGLGNYTVSPFSESLRSLARVIKLGLGVETAAVDYRGVWDTHENIPLYFTQAVQDLSDSLFAFTDDLGPLMSRVTVVIMTEFGRRVEENASGGTDHGEASVMLALGAGVNGGKIYGQWPGLADAQLSGGDLHVTTDYRQVLAEALAKRAGQPAVEAVFPTITYAPLGIFRQA